MAVLLLIRHGHTDTAGKTLTGQGRGVHLNDRGRREAEALVERLHGIPIDAIYASPLERCRETAAPLARDRGLPVRTRRGLLEVDYGDWTGRTIASLRRTRLWKVVQQRPSAVRFPDGESLLEVQTRALTELDAIAAAHPERTIAVVTHADVLRLVLAHYAGMHPDHVQRLVVEPASVTAVAVAPGGVRVLKVNDTGGLDDLAPARRARGRSPKVRG